MIRQNWKKLRFPFQQTSQHFQCSRNNTNKKHINFPKPAQEKSQCSLLGFIRVSPAPEIATEIVADLVNSAVEKYDPL